MRSDEVNFSIYLILPAGLGAQPVKEMSTRNRKIIFPEEQSAAGS
jgi:hypothetical protein